MDTDHDKGLISISSSSNLPTPDLPTPRPPYLLKPLPEALRKKIEDKHSVRWYRDDPVPYCCYSHLIEPCPVLDPDDPRSYDKFENPEKADDGSPYKSLGRHLWYPCKIPLPLGLKMDGGPLFELYSITIQKVDPLRDFSSIFIKGSNTGYYPMIIYKLPETEKIPPLNQPLPLKNIFRIPKVEGLKDLTIALSNPANGGWVFRYPPPGTDYGQRTVTVRDELTESEALISYELIKSAAIADLKFTFLDEKNRLLTILSGSITATTNGDPSTERIIRQFSSSEVLQTNKPVPVNRSVFVVPLGRSLHIHVNLEVAVGGIRQTIRETIELLAPNVTKSEEKQITLIKRECIMIGVKVSWWDFL